MIRLKALEISYAPVTAAKKLKIHPNINDVIILLKKQLNVCLHFTHILHTTQVTTPFCKKRFEKGIFAEIYYLFTSEWLLVYLLHILSHWIMHWGTALLTVHPVAFKTWYFEKDLNPLCSVVRYEVRQIAFKLFWQLYG